MLRLAKIFLDPFDNDGATDGGKTGVAISVENLLQEARGRCCTSIEASCISARRSEVSFKTLLTL